MDTILVHFHRNGHEMDTILVHFHRSGQKMDKKLTREKWTKSNHSIVIYFMIAACRAGRKALVVLEHGAVDRAELLPGPRVHLLQVLPGRGLALVHAELEEPGKGPCRPGAES